MSLVEYINFKDQTCAIILRSNYNFDGIKFFTPNEFSQQLGYMKHPKNHIILPHVHNELPREVKYTKEVLFVKSGKVRVDFYDDSKNYFKSKIIEKGDFLLLAFGGHGFQMLEKSELIEIKQGPYAGQNDKTRFPNIDENKIIFKD